MFLYFAPLLLLLPALSISQDLPTLYEYYTGDGIQTGLSVNQPYFTLNNKNITILSGTIHYFRVHPQYWRDRLRKLRAAGLNTVETYIAWNLHEPQDGAFDFGDGGSDFHEFLNFTTFLKIAQEEDLFVIVRPGPYICAEWEWGGLPSWLLRHKNLTVRTSESQYLSYVTRYFYRLLPLLHDLQFTQGGPIIMVQIENEYGSAPVKDLDYLKHLYDMYQAAGIVELLVTSDGASSGTSGSLPGLVLQTANFGGNPVGNFDTLKSFQPDRPIMAMEYWAGWFDHWSESHHTVSSATFGSDYETMLTYPASINLYMFHGGTNFGFMNGANIVIGDNSGYAPTTTSYDYDCPLAENGDYTDKYEVLVDLIAKYNPIKTQTPPRPELIPRVAYPSVVLTEIISFPDLIQQVSHISSSKPISMELLSTNSNNGQSYGYIVYRANVDLAAGAVLQIGGHVRDTVMVLVNNDLVSPPLRTSSDLNNFGSYRVRDSTLTLTDTDLTNATLELIVENWGRANFGNLYQQYKGLIEENIVTVDGEEIDLWDISSLEFRSLWNWGLSNWSSLDSLEQTSPTVYKGNFEIMDEPRDTYIDMQEWGKGIVIVNTFVLGRYASIGPQQALYIPAPLLRKEVNEILIFEHFKPGTEIRFSDEPIFKTVK